MRDDLTATEALQRLHSRRKFIQAAAVGSAIPLLGGGLYAFTQGSPAHAETRPDGRPRVPPGQRVLEALKPMGGRPGDPRTSSFRLKVHGAVKNELNLSLNDLLNLSPVVRALDVHCVTGWSVLGAKFKGVLMKDLAARAEVLPQAKHVVFEAAHDYTANTTIKHALHPDVMLAWELDGQRLARAHGAPLRAVNPHLYFWKSPKWLTGIRFVERDEPGYWEVRGYNNHADPWKEERYA